MKVQNKFSGMTGFTIVWAGQLISMLGTYMTNFAIIIWLWQITGKATPFAIFGFISAITRICAAPLVGGVIDRWNRKFTMAISDIIAGCTSILLLILYLSGHLQVWHLYLIAVISNFFETFQFPAFSAATSVMVSKEHYGRTSGMNSIAEALSGMLSPILAAGLMGFIGLQGLLIIDILSFIIAISALFLVSIPKPAVSQANLESKGSFWKESMYGFKYLYQRKSLFALLFVFLAMNMSLSFAGVLQNPMILARSNNSKWILGGVQSISTIGGLISGLLLMIWGGPKNRIRGLFVSMTILGVGVFLRGCGTGIIIWGIGGFITFFAAVIANACSQAFWQTKVALDVQGRVFAARSMVGGFASPLTMILSGPLADHFFEPGMLNGGTLAKTFGWICGTEQGSGIALMFLIAGICAITVAIIGYMSSTIRNADTLLPDHDLVTESTTA